MTRFYAEYGYLPGSRQLVNHCREANVALEARGKKAWAEWIEEAVDCIANYGLPPPPPYGAGPPDDWRPIEVDVGALPPRVSWSYSRVEVIEAVREFERGLPATANRGSQALWRAFSRRNPAAPSAGVITKHGGLVALLDEASRPDWQERAQAYEAEHGRSGKPARRQSRRSTNRGVTKKGLSRRVAILKTLDDGGSATAKTMHIPSACPSRWFDCTR